MTSHERDWSLESKTAFAAINAALDAVPVGLIVIDTSGTVLSVNQRFLAVANPSGRSKNPVFLADFEVALELPTAPGDVEIGTDGQLVWTPDGNGGWVGTLTEDQSNTSPSQGGTDSLTGLGNRQSLLEQYTAMQARGGAHALYLDLDRFKRVNDTLGHETGDALLRNVARRLRSVLRSDDIAGRIGGDEFAALIVGPIDEQQVFAIAKRLIDRISRPFLINGTQVLVGASIGLAKSDSISFETALRYADVALYESKRLGRGRATWYEPKMLKALEERRELEHALRSAVLLEEFVVYFQPQYSFGAKSITGFEALVRWQRPEGIVPPSEFIPIAEETGLMSKIGAYVLDVACAQASLWPQPFTVAVNVSPLQFMDDTFIETVKHCLDRSGLLPSRLELELTETLLVNDASVVEARMMTLHDMGVRLSLDDFGTGYASLNYLRMFPFNKIKIDQAFVREPLADESARKIAAAVAGLGADLGMDVIAEGVETKEQMERMQSQGASAVQGYFLSKPIPADQVSSFVTQWNKDDTFKERDNNDNIGQ